MSELQREDVLKRKLGMLLLMRLLFVRVHVGQETGAVTIKIRVILVYAEGLYERLLSEIEGYLNEQERLRA